MKIAALDLDWEPEADDPDDSIRLMKILPENWRGVLRLHGFRQVHDLDDCIRYANAAIADLDYMRSDDHLVRVDHICRFKFAATFSGEARFHHFRNHHHQAGFCWSEVGALRTVTNLCKSVAETLHALDAACNAEKYRRDLWLDKARVLDYENCRRTYR